MAKNSPLSLIITWIIVHLFASLLQFYHEFSVPVVSSLRRVTRESMAHVEKAGPLSVAFHIIIPSHTTASLLF